MASLSDLLAHLAVHQDSTAGSASAVFPISEPDSAQPSAQHSHFRRSLQKRGACADWTAAEVLEPQVLRVHFAHPGTDEQTSRVHVAQAGTDAEKLERQTSRVHLAQAGNLQSSRVDVSTTSTHAEQAELRYACNDTPPDVDAAGLVEFPNDVDADGNLIAQTTSAGSTELGAPTGLKRMRSSFVVGVRDRRKRQRKLLCRSGSGAVGQKDGFLDEADPGQGLHGDALLARLMARRAARNAEEDVQAAPEDGKRKPRASNPSPERVRSTALPMIQAQLAELARVRFAAKTAGWRAGHTEELRELELAPEMPANVRLGRTTHVQRPRRGGKGRGRGHNIPPVDAERRAIIDEDLTWVLEPLDLRTSAECAADATDAWEAEHRALISEAVRAHRRCANTRARTSSIPNEDGAELGVEELQALEVLQRFRQRVKDEPGRRVLMRRYGVCPKGALLLDRDRRNVGRAALEGELPAARTISNEFEAATFIPTTELSKRIEEARPGLLDAWHPYDAEWAMEPGGAADARPKDFRACTEVAQGYGSKMFGAFVGRLARTGLTQEYPFLIQAGLDHFVCEACNSWVGPRSALQHNKRCSVADTGRKRLFQQVCGEDVGLMMRFRHNASTGTVTLSASVPLAAVVRRVCWACYWEPDELRCEWRLARRSQSTNRFPTSGTHGQATDGSPARATHVHISDRAHATATHAPAAEQDRDAHIATKGTASDTKSPATDRRTTSDTHQPTTDRRTTIDTHAPATDRRTTIGTHSPTTGKRTTTDTHSPTTGRHTTTDTHSPTTGRHTTIATHSPTTGRRTTSDTNTPTTDHRSTSATHSPTTNRCTTTVTHVSTTNTTVAPSPTTHRRPTTATHSTTTDHRPATATHSPTTNRCATTATHEPTTDTTFAKATTSNPNLSHRNPHVLTHAPAHVRSATAATNPYTANRAEVTDGSPARAAHGPSSGRADATATHAPATERCPAPDRDERTADRATASHTKSPATVRRTTIDAHSPSTDRRTTSDTHQPTTDRRTTIDTHAPATDRRTTSDTHPPITGKRTTSDTHPQVTDQRPTAATHSLTTTRCLTKVTNAPITDTTITHAPNTDTTITNVPITNVPTTHRFSTNATTAAITEQYLTPKMRARAEAHSGHYDVDPHSDADRSRSPARWRRSPNSGRTPADEAYARVQNPVGNQHAVEHDDDAERSPSPARPTLKACSIPRSDPHPGADSEMEHFVPRFNLRSSFGTPAAHQPRSFLKPLSPAQLHSLGWMQSRESDTDGYTSAQTLRQPLSESDVTLEVRLSRTFKGVCGGILGDQLGYGKTACMIGLIAETKHESITDSLRLRDWPGIAARRVLTNATLVVTPPNLFDQWLREFRKFVSPAVALNVLAVPNHNRLRSLTVNDFVAADVVLVSFRFFFSGAYQRYFDELTKPGLKIWDETTVAQREEHAPKRGRASARGRGRTRARAEAVAQPLAHFGKSHQPPSRGASVAAASDARVKTERDTDSECEEKLEPGLAVAAPKVKVERGAPEVAAATNGMAFAEPIGNDVDPCVETRPRSNGPKPRLSKYYLDLRARKDYAPQRYLDVERRTRGLLQTGNAEELGRSPALFEMFHFKRVVFDEFHQVARASSQQSSSAHRGCKLPFYALHALQGRAHWGLTATPLLSSASAVAEMASLLRVFIPYDDDEEAQRFLDTWVTSNTWDSSKVGLEEHWVEVELTSLERALYLSQRNVLADGAGGANTETRASERRLLQLCTHFDPDNEAPVDGAAEVLERILRSHRERLEKTQQKLVDLEKRRGQLQERCNARDWLHAVLPASARETNLVCAHSTIPQVTALAEAAAQAKDGALAPELVLIERDLRRLAQRVMDNVPPDGEAPAAHTTTAVCEPCANLITWEDKLKQLNRSRGHALAEQRQIEQQLRFGEGVLACVEHHGGQRGTPPDCCACMDSLDARPVVILPCGHLFHEACAETVVIATGRCPLCHNPTSVQMLTRMEKPEAAVGVQDSLRASCGSKVAKVIETIQKIRKSEGDATKCVVFIQWDAIVAHLERGLKAVSIEPLILRGSLVQRQKIVARFVDGQTSNSSVLILSLEQSPVGLNLVCAHHVLLVHPMHADQPQEAVNYEIQAVGRVRRQGQRQTVHVHRFVARDTVEELLARRHHAAFLQQERTQAAKSAADAAAIAAAIGSKAATEKLEIDQATMRG